MSTAFNVGMSQNTEHSPSKRMPSSVAVAHAELMAAVAHCQDKAAFSELFIYFSPRLRAYLIKTGASMGVVEELVQEVMLTAWRKANLYQRTQGGVSTWLYTIARNTFIDHVRREKRPGHDPDDPLLALSSDENVEHDVGLKENSEVLCGAMETLSKEQLEVIRHFYFGHKTHAEIAQELELPLGTVKSRVRLAVEHLRRAMRDRIDD